MFSPSLEHAMESWQKRLKIIRLFRSQSKNDQLENGIDPDPETQIGSDSNFEYVCDARREIEPAVGTEMDSSTTKTDPFVLAKKYFVQALNETCSNGMRFEMDGGRFARGKEQTASFLRHGEAERIIDRDCLDGKVFGELIKCTPDQRKTYCSSILGKPGTRTILLVILAFGNESMLRTFERYFLQRRLPETHEVSDEDLPFNDELAKYIFGPQDGLIFFKYQFGLLAAELKEGTFGVKFQAPRCLPFVERDLLGSGAYGTVYRVKIERGHFRFRQPQSRNEEPVTLAMKTFEPNEIEYRSFKAEDKILKNLINSSNCPSSIMTSVCSVEYTFSNSKFPYSSIFFPEARCDLTDYISDPGSFPASDTERLQNIRRMLGVCEGLEWLRKNLFHDSVNQRFVSTTYYHCDLKPDNILVYEDPSAIFDSIVFKISDFGQAHRLSEEPGASRGKRTLPGVTVSRYEDTFLAPEILNNKTSRQYTPKSDVWAFGCILLLVIVYNFDNAAGIEEFEEERVNQSIAQRGDHFAKSGSKGCNEAVTARMSRLHGNFSLDGQIDSIFNQNCLGYLRKSVLVKESRRDDITTVRERLVDFYNDRPPVKADTIRRSEIPKNATHCGSSPEGIVFFYTPKSILFYRDKEERHYHIITPSTSDIASCGGKRLLFVSMSQGAFKCIIESIAIDPPQGPQTRILEDPGVSYTVHKRTFSADGTKIAIAYQLPHEKSSSVQIRLYSIKGPSRNPNCEVGFDSVGLEFERENLTFQSEGISCTLDLCFSKDSETLYYAGLYDHCANQSRVKVVLWNTLTHKNIGEDVIEDMGSPSRSCFITNIVPLNSQKGLIFVLNEASIVQLTLYGGYLHSEVAYIQKIGGLKSLFLSSDDNKVVLLATSSTTEQVQIFGSFLSSLLENPLTSPQRLDIVGRVHYDPEQDDACVREDGGKMSMLITRLIKKETYCINIERLFAVQGK